MEFQNDKVMKKRISDFIENDIKHSHVIALISAIKLVFLLYFIYYIYHDLKQGFVIEWKQDYAFYMLVGFIAQMIDGALGMAYGVSCSTFLLSLGIPPAVVTTNVHTAEVFTTGASGISHLLYKNVNIRLLIKLLAGGIVGAIIGAFLISEVFDGKVIKPFVSAYLLILGVRILIKSFKELGKFVETKVMALGFFGALLDTIGGGGWGPIVTTNLIDKRESPQRVIGSVNTAEFFITLISSGLLLVLVGLKDWPMVLFLILGGLIASPIGAYLVKTSSPKVLMRFVGVLIILVSAYNLYKSI